jgi:2-dehydro-3-deoxyphosphogluconate aldolase/(4S)-4-hydroxy-2-oxoglutarate aldolase
MINELTSSAMMAIVRTTSFDEAREIGRALIASKVSVLEFTTTCPRVFDLIEEFAQDLSIYVGVGTALSTNHVVNAKSAGAQFVVSPNTDSGVIRATKSAGLISMPGVATATDVATAINSGCDALKLFPASTYGPRHLKALRDPFPHQIWVATGGVVKEDIAMWLSAGVNAFGLGGPLSGGGISKISESVELFRSAISEARKSGNSET